MGFSVLDSSIRFPSPTPLLTSPAPVGSQLLNSPLATATTDSAHLTSASDTGFSSLISLISHPHSMHPGWRTQTREATPSADHKSNASSPNSNISAGSIMPQGLDKGAKIGIIASITVVVILTLIAVGFCFFDGRQRLQRMREKRKERRNADSNMWETEMQGGRGRKRDSKKGGLWDGLRIDPDVPDNDEGIDKKEDILERNEDRGRSVPMWERVGEARTEGADTKTGGRHEGQEPERIQEWPVYMPRERMSVVSSEGSSVGANIPVVGTGPLEKDIGR